MIILFNGFVVSGLIDFESLNVDVIVKFIDILVFFNKVIVNFEEYGVLDVICFNSDGVLCVSEICCYVVLFYYC